MRGLLWRRVKFFLFLLDAERAHRITVSLIRWARKLGGDTALRLASGAPSVPVSLPVEAFGISFTSRVGLAAGFDKDAELVSALPALGFGFVEIGTVTPRPQPGNEKPRLFREPARECVFNRMGFNGAGAEVIAQRLAAARPSLPLGFRVGVNIGKNKDTPLEDAARDYALAASAFSAPGLVDYLVINVSSPNTPGLRSLQTIEALQPIVDSVQRTMSSCKKAPPILLKLAPEVNGEDLSRIIRGVEAWGINGWVLTNTLGGNLGALTGGWSGRVVTDASRKSLEEACSVTRLPVISVGGIMDVEEAALRIRLGASLVQIYSGWIFRGPTFPTKIAARLSS